MSDEGGMTEGTSPRVGATGPGGPADGTATLRRVGGAGRVEIRTDPAIDELFRSSHEPGTPEVVVEGDKVTVRYAIHRLLGRLAANEETEELTDAIQRFVAIATPIARIALRGARFTRIPWVLVASSAVSIGVTVTSEIGRAHV